MVKKWNARFVKFCTGVSICSSIVLYSVLVVVLAFLLAGVLQSASHPSGVSVAELEGWSWLVVFLVISAFCFPIPIIWNTFRESMKEEG